MTAIDEKARRNERVAHTEDAERPVVGGEVKGDCKLYKSRRPT